MRAFSMTSWMRGGASTGRDDQPSASSAASSPAPSGIIGSGEDPADHLGAPEPVADLCIEGEADGGIDDSADRFPPGPKRA